MSIDTSKGYNPLICKPTVDRAHIWFLDDKGILHEGMWIEEEQMFFIGFEHSGDFRFKFEVNSWGYLPETHQ